MWRCLALLTCGGCCWDSSAVHQPLVGGDTAQAFRLHAVFVVGVPYAFGEGAAANPHLGVVGVSVAHLTPQADNSADDVVLGGAVGYQVLQTVLVEVVHPGEIAPIGTTQIVPNTQIQVILPVETGDDLVVDLGDVGSSPPMNQVSLFNLDVVVVHPVDWSFLRIELLDDFVLSPTVVQFEVSGSSTLQLVAFCGHELSAVYHATQGDFITAQVKHWIGENFYDFGEYLFDEGVGGVQGDVERSHVVTGRACHRTVCGCPTP